MNYSKLDLMETRHVEQTLNLLTGNREKQLLEDFKMYAEFEDFIDEENFSVLNYDYNLRSLQFGNTLYYVNNVYEFVREMNRQFLEFIKEHGQKYVDLTTADLLEREIEEDKFIEAWEEHFELDYYEEHPNSILDEKLTIVRDGETIKYGEDHLIDWVKMRNGIVIYSGNILYEEGVEFFIKQLREEYEL